MAAELKWCYDIACLIYGITVRRVVTSKRAKKSYTERKTEECFQRKTIGSCSKKFSSRSKNPFQHRKCKTDWRKKLEQSIGQFCDLNCKFLVHCGQDEKYRRVIIDIIPCVGVTTLKTDAFMAIVTNVDKLMVREKPSAKWRRGLAMISCYSEKIQGCVSEDSDPMNSILQKNWDWTLRRDTSTSQDVPGTKMNSGTKRE